MRRYGSLININLLAAHLLDSQGKPYIIYFWLKQMDSSPSHRQWEMQLYFPNDIFIEAKKNKMMRKNLIWNLHVCLFSHCDPLGRPTVVITIFTHVRPSVRPSTFFKISGRQNYFQNSDCYKRDCESGRVDHWWHLSCTYYVWKMMIFWWRKWF